MPLFAQGIGNIGDSTISKTAAQTGSKTTTTESSSSATIFSFNVCAPWPHATIYGEMACDHWTPWTLPWTYIPAAMYLLPLTTRLP